MSPSRTLPPDRRQRLLETAVREFAEAGYQAASLNRIIRACGMSKSSFYYYVASKDALFDLVVTELGDTLLRTLDLPDPERLAGPDFWTQLHELAERLTREGQTNPRLIEFGRLFGLRDAPQDPGRPLTRVREAINDWVQRALRAGHASGMVRDDLPHALQRELVLAVLWTMDAWTVQQMHAGEIVQPAELAAAEVDAIRRLLAPA